jgi:hypothetical protein
LLHFILPGFAGICSLGNKSAAKYGNTNCKKQKRFHGLVLVDSANIGDRKALIPQKASLDILTLI